jgi:hypothetical protein
MLASTHRAASRRAGSGGRESISGPPRFVFVSSVGEGRLLTDMTGPGHVPPFRYTVGILPRFTMLMLTRTQLRGSGIQEPGARQVGSASL